MTELQLALLSFSHKNAPIDFRDRIALGNEASLHFLTQARETDFIRESAILSTCNRTEFYFLTRDPDRLFPWIVQSYREYRDLDISGSEAPPPAVFAHAAAARHLMEVAGGLESMLLGENQILSQVKSAYELMLSSGYPAPVLGHLFQDAIRAGKAIRNRTGLCRGSVSVSLAAVELARKIYSNFSGRTVALVGAGETSDLVAAHFQELGVSRFTILNRGVQRRQALAHKYSAAAYGLDQISRILVTADIIVTATRSPWHLIGADQCRTAVKQRQGRSLLLIDISTPRNVAPDVAGIDQVFLYDIDDIQYVIADHLEKRRQEIPAAQAIVRQIQEEFLDWYRTLEVVPTISRLNTYFNSVRERELARYVHKTSPQEYAALEEMSRRLVRRLLHYPIVELRQRLGSENHNLGHIDALWELFHLRESGEESGS